MQRLLAFFLLSLTAAAFAQTATTTKKRTTVTHSSAAASSKRTTKPGVRTHSTTVRGRAAKVKPAPSYQLHPDPERYQQIQQALADRGYFKGQVNGQWGDDSIEAMKKFQGDQKLDTDGKINSLSLIGLGLGPRHDGSSGHDTPAPPQATSEAQTPLPPPQ